MPNLTIEPTGGIANRMRSLLSAIAFSRKHKYTLTVNWIENDELNCPLEQMFEINFPLKIIQNKHLSLNIRSTFEKEIKSKYYNIFFDMFKHNTGVCFKEKNGDSYEDVMNLQKYFSKGQNIYIQTCFAFHPEYLEEMETISFAEAIQKRIQNATKPFTNDTVGLHIRRTDHGAAIENSNDDKFIAVIEKNILDNPNSSFFLSTDDSLVESNLKTRFGKKIITNPKEFSRNSNQGIYDALVDLGCLSECRTIYGSFISSFSEFASAFGKKPLIVVQ